MDYEKKADSPLSGLSVLDLVGEVFGLEQAEARESLNDLMKVFRRIDAHCRKNGNPASHERDFRIYKNFFKKEEKMKSFKLFDGDGDYVGFVSFEGDEVVAIQDMYLENFYDQSGKRLTRLQILGKFDAREIVDDAEVNEGFFVNGRSCLGGGSNPLIAGGGCLPESITPCRFIRYNRHRMIFGAYVDCVRPESITVCFIRHGFGDNPCKEYKKYASRDEANTAIKLWKECPHNNGILP